MKRDSFSYLILLGFLLLFGLRLVHIEADPPADLSWSGGLFFDEGALAHNARNKVLFGEWEMDEWNDFYYSPILTYIKWAVFSLFGVGLAQLRIVPVVFSWLTLWILYLTLRITLKRSVAILGIFLLGFNYIYLMYNRIGLTETPFAFFAALTLYFWQRGLHERSLRYAGGCMFFAGVSCFTVHIFKTIFYFLPVPIVALILLWLIAGERAERRRLLRLFGYFLAGMVVTMAIWIATFYYPNYDAIHQAGTYVKILSIPHSVSSFFENVVRTPFFSIFLQTPVILILALGYLLHLIYLLFHHRTKLQPLDVFVSLWFLAHLFFFLGYSYRPTRYYVPIIPSMAVLAALGIMRILQLQDLKFTDKISFWFWAIFWLLGGIVWTYILIPLMHQYGAVAYITVPRLNLYSNLLAGAILSLAITVVMAWWIRQHRGGRWHTPSRFLQGVAFIAILFAVIMNSIHYYRWASSPQYVVRNTSRELGTMLDDAFIAGLETPTLCLENTHRPLYVWENFTNYENTLERFKLTHLFLAEFNDAVGYYRRKFPELMKRAILLKTYWIKGSRFHLYSIVEPSIDKIIVEHQRYTPDEPVTVTLKIKNYDHRKPRKVEVGWLLRPHSESTPVITATESLTLEGLEEKALTLSKQIPPGSYDLMTGLFSSQQDGYEAEDMSGQVGYDYPDPDASKKQVRRGELNTQGFLVYGPYQRYPAGKFDTDFTLKYSAEDVTPEGELAIIDVAADSGKTILARMALKTQDFKNMNTYQTFRISYFLKIPQKLEFRVFTHGRAELWVDTISTSFVRGEWHEKPIVVEAY